MANAGYLTGKKSKGMVVLVFKIPYYTQWGQSLVISGSEPSLGSWNLNRALTLSPVHEGDDLIWYGRVSVPLGFKCEYCYYVVDEGRNPLRWESGKKRILTLPDGLVEGDEVEFRNLWQTASDTIFQRSAFKSVIFGGRDSSEPSEKVSEQFALNKSFGKQDTIGLQFIIQCPLLEAGAKVSIIGSVARLGSWRVQDALQMNYAGESVWKAECLIQKDELPIKYKYCKVGAQGTQLEVGPLRELKVDLVSDKTPRCIVLSDGNIREVPWRGAGVAIPMFSVRSDDDIGVGEFLDLKLLVDWAVNSGIHLVQLLPVNDTSVHGMWWDSYPYSSLSVFALHPLYLRVQTLSQSIPDDIKEDILRAKKQLDQKDVDYEATMSAKLSIARRIFDIEKDKILASEAFRTFFSENQEWLKPYAAFCFLRDFFETSDHSQWGRFSQFTQEKLDKLVSEDSLHYNVICFHYYVQYHLHIQLSEAAAYARKKKVVLKGDLPIGVDRNSVDTWVYPNLFRMNTSTGAPPDYFDKNGQNWGFPTYNWEEMSKDNYGWWRARLTQMAKYFTAYRIDHILGFFRIWELPDHATTGLVGKFRPSIPLTQEELEREGIWDFDRLALPYINEGNLQDTFGSLWTVVASNFLNYRNPIYEFKEDCNTEKKIIYKLQSSPVKSLWIGNEDKIRRGLFALLQNIVLIRDPEDLAKFYPRFNLEDTTSFKDLDEHSKNVLRRLYHDYYFVRQENLWRQNALKTLPVLLNSSDMLACGEDLGLIPSCVHPVMQELGLIGLRIQRMPSESNLEFGIPSQYSYTTVCAPSCHDCSTLRAWWEEDEERRSRFYETFIGDGDAPPAQCTPEIAHFIIHQHFESPSMWAIFPLQDLLALKEEYMTRPAPEETINDPTNPKHYWRFRVHVSLETLLRDASLQSTIKELVVSSGRSFPGNKAGAAGVPVKHDGIKDDLQQKLSAVNLSGSS